MSQSTDNAFFESLKEWSERKLTLIQKYLDGAVKIMQIMGEVYYVDCFAGRGTYGKEGEPQVPGSPLRAAQLAQRYIDEGRRYSLRCINIESHAKRFQGLQAATAPYKNITTNLEGSFTANISTILALLGQRPAVCFLDPFGVDGLDWAAVQRLIKRQGATDIWLRFDTDEVRRRAGYYDSPLLGADKQFDILMRTYGFIDKDQLHALLDDPTTPEARKQAALALYLDLLRNEFKRAKQEGYAEAYRVGSMNQETQYYLVFATSNKKGLILASDIVHDVEENYQRGIEHNKLWIQPSMFDPTDEEIEEAKVKGIQEEISRRWCGKTIDRMTLHASLLDQRFGKIKRTHVTQAIQALIKSKTIERCDGRISEDRTHFTFRS